MTKFITFKKAISQHLETMFEHDLFKMDIDKNEIWDVYLKSFPEGSNPIYIEKTYHDCNCCRQFIRDIGGLVYFNGYDIVSVWDVDINYPYKQVTQALSDYVKSKSIKNAFLHNQKSVGTDSNKQLLEDSTVITWHHFYTELPNNLVKRDLNTILSNYQSSKDVLKRGLEEISISTIETVLELIEQNSIYRGEEHKYLVSNFLELKKQYNKLVREKEKSILCWSTVIKSDALSRIRNSVIGTLMLDIENGVELDKAVQAFESKVAPSNYKRPKAIVTAKMIELAQVELEKLGLTDSLKRRPAIENDILINDVLFINRSSKDFKQDNIFDTMKKDVKVDLRKLKRVEEVTIDKFISDIVPKSNSIELLFENRHENNLVALIAPRIESSPLIFKWNNNFSWSYNGNVADSIKEKVKKAGGCVDAVLRWSLSWFNTDDLDIHVTEPNGNHIYFENKQSITSGKLDVDMNVNNPIRDAVENIVWDNKSTMLEGDYEVYVNNFKKREDIDVGFIVEMEYKSQIYTFKYPFTVKQDENISVAKFNFSKNNGIRLIKSLPEDNISRHVWNIDTQKYHNVRMLINSPNFWCGNNVGNKHFFFILDSCYNPNPSRGFYNEFLKQDLIQHGKVFELLASKTKVEPSKDQLCGLGFSSTKKDEFYCKVSGAFQRVIKVIV